MGSVRKIKRKKGVVWRAETCVNGVRSSSNHDTHVEAVIWLDREEKILRGEIQREEGATSQSDMRWSEAVDRFITEAQVSPNQKSSYEWSAKSIGKSIGGKTFLGAITPTMVSSHVLDRMNRDGVGVSSIRNELAFIRCLYRHANEKWGCSFESPELNVKRPRHKKQSREEKIDQVIKHDELVAIFQEAEKRPNNLALYLKFLLYTGMRPSEAALLYWDRQSVAVEKERTRKTMPIGYVDLKRGGFSKIGTKTEVKRFVPAHPVAIEILERLKVEGKRLVFLDDSKENLADAYKYYRRTFDTTLNNARIDGDPLRSDITFYSFRHTFRTKLEEIGVSTAIAEQIIGHNDTSFKFTYIHLSDQALIDAVAKVDFLI